MKIIGRFSQKIFTIGPLNRTENGKRPNPNKSTFEHLTENLRSKSDLYRDNANLHSHQYDLHKNMSGKNRYFIHEHFCIFVCLTSLHDMI